MGYSRTPEWPGPCRPWWSPPESAAGRHPDALPRRSALSLCLPPYFPKCLPEASWARFPSLFRAPECFERVPPTPIRSRRLPPRMRCADSRDSPVGLLSTSLVLFAIYSRSNRAGPVRQDASQGLMGSKHRRRASISLRASVFFGTQNKQHQNTGSLRFAVASGRAFMLSRTFRRTKEHQDTERPDSLSRRVARSNSGAWQRERSLPQMCLKGALGSSSSFETRTRAIEVPVRPRHARSSGRGR